MPRLVRDVLAERAAGAFVGRCRERTLLREAVEGDERAVVFLHGIAGIGKTALLQAFAAEMRALGAPVVVLDCRSMEPTGRGVLGALGRAVPGTGGSLAALALRLGRLGPRVILALDHYEAFRLADAWLRQSFVPALPEHVRVLLVGRDPAGSAWLVSPAWAQLVRVVTLGPLDEVEAIDLLTRAGLSAASAARIARFAAGHPLALRLAASVLGDSLDPEPHVEAAALHRVVDELTRLVLGDIGDPSTRAAVEAASVVRRATASLVREMLPELPPHATLERLRTLPFVEAGGDGLHIHGAVQHAIEAHLASIDPSRHLAYRRAAWRCLRAELGRVAPADLWRYTADLLYLIKNPVVREAFFPSGVHRYAVEPAIGSDRAAIEAIARRHEGPEGARLLAAWWAAAPETFAAVRDPTGATVGFYCLVDPAAACADLLEEDPVARAWCGHLAADPVPPPGRALLIRRWLSASGGEALSPVQAVCWLDIKRVYLEQRPGLRRVYLVLRDPEPYGSVARQLGFRPLPGSGVDLDGARYHSAMLDFGPASVDGWLLGLIAAELGLEQEDVLDLEARELVLERGRVPLTRLEFALLRHIAQREGRVVPRDELLREVWGYRYDGASNVVDVVVRALRKKLASRARMIETVRGVGYRFRRSQGCP